MTLRIVHYINQFYAGKGGEDMANYQPESVPGPVGPGAEMARILKSSGGEAEVVGTVICGDSYYGENIEADITAGEVVGIIVGNGERANSEDGKDNTLAIDNSASPRTGPVYRASGSMAIVNLLLCTLGVVLAALAALRSLKNNRYSAKHGRKISQKYLMAAIFMAIAGVAIFLLTQDMSARKVLVDQWTIANAALLIFEVAVLSVSRKGKEVEN